MEDQPKNNENLQKALADIVQDGSNNNKYKHNK